MLLMVDRFMTSPVVFHESWHCFWRRVKTAAYLGICFIFTFSSYGCNIIYLVICDIHCLYKRSTSESNQHWIHTRKYSVIYREVKKKSLNFFTTSSYSDTYSCKHWNRDIVAQNIWFPSSRSTCTHVVSCACKNRKERMSDWEKQCSRIITQVWTFLWKNECAQQSPLSIKICKVIHKLVWNHEHFWICVVEFFRHLFSNERIHHTSFVVRCLRRVDREKAWMNEKRVISPWIWDWIKFVFIHF